MNRLCKQGQFVLGEGVESFSCIVTYFEIVGIALRFGKGNPLILVLNACADIVRGDVCLDHFELAGFLFGAVGQVVDGLDGVLVFGRGGCGARAVAGGKSERCGKCCAIDINLFHVAPWQ